MEAKIYLKAAKRRTTAITRTDGTTLRPELVGFVVVSAAGCCVTDAVAAWEVEVAATEPAWVAEAVSVADGATAVVVALL